MASPSTVEIAPRGDVVLICGQGEDAAIKLRVDSHVLSLASPVFKAMLEPRFREGTELAASGFVEIPLPDDDPGAMKILCRTLHMVGNIFKEERTLREVLSISSAADKYDCSTALAFASYYWINELVGKVSEFERPLLLVAAYRLKQEKTFGQLSRDIVMKSSADARYIVDGTTCLQELQNAVAVLDTSRRILVKQLADTIETTMFKECSDGLDTSFGVCKPHCTYILGRGSDFMRRLKKTKLWPLSAMATRPLEEMCKDMKDFFVEFTHTRTQCAGASSSDCRGAFLPSIPHLSSRFQNAANKVEQEAPRLCMKCVYQGEHKEEGKCGKDHPN